MVSEKLEKALNEQVNKEMASAYLYFGMATYFETEDLPGFASWMHNQAEEEMTHAMKIYRFLLDVGSKPVFGDLSAPKTEYGKAIDVMKQVLEHEKFVTKSITDLYKLADEENNYTTMSFLKWFIDEQVEEEATVSAIIGRFKYCDSNHCLMMIDQEMGKLAAAAAAAVATTATAE
ncbi:MAG: ferritin [Treponema sp.]|nr:MAG: ferritin [Treponema sp.]